MSNKIQIKVEELNALPATEIVENQHVEQKFIQMYNAIWGMEIGEQMYVREKFHFNRLLHENPSLQECSKLSLYGCFLDMAVNGLTLDQSGRPQVYLLPSCAKVKLSDGKEAWEKRATLSITAYGEVYMRQRAGQIKHVDNPVIVYDGDVFEASTDENGQKKIKYTAKLPRVSNKPVAAFIRITRNDGSIDIQWMVESDWQRLSAYSAKRNKGQANALYSSNNGGIDTGFLENKMIKHAFDAYPKVRTGNYTVLETETEESPIIDYGVVDESITNEPAPASRDEDPNVPFGEDKQLEAPTPVTVNVSKADEEEGF